MCYLWKLSNTSHFVPLFLAHGDVVVGIAIFHIKLSTLRLGSFICSSLILQGSWSDHYNLILKKGTPPRYVNVGGHPMESVSHGLRKKKRWGGVPKLYKRAPMCQIFKELGTALTSLLWKIVRHHCQSLTWNNHLSKPNFYLSVLQMKSSSTCLITTSLREGPFFYFYIESPPSIFMHRLREHKLSFWV
jgi:hypothetical protein